MVATDKVFAGSIPEIYDRFLVPLIFEPYASDLAGRVAAIQPPDVLETAAGTGVLTRALASRLARSARIVATDLNQPMLDQASRRQTEGTVEWKQADALALPFGDEGFDVVACQFGVMFFPDKVQGFKEARRMLRPGGRFLFNVWDRIENNEFADVVTDALAEVFPDDPPRFMARTPHGHHDGGPIREALMAAGFTDISIDAVPDVEQETSARLQHPPRLPVSLDLVGKEHHAELAGHDVEARIAERQRQRVGLLPFGAATGLSPRGLVEHRLVEIGGDETHGRRQPRCEGA